MVGLIFLLSAVFALGEEEASVSLRSNRKLFTMSQRHGHIWGRCDRWDRILVGCHLKTESQCSNRLSTGPANADVEIRLGGLPPSTANASVHLQWWSARKSQPDYKPLRNPMETTVYWNVLHAYPKYNDADFNGGNVQVDTNGIATIRIQAPATYRLYCWIPMPHIHLRICSGTRFVHAPSDTLYFGTRGPYLKGGCQRQSPYQILSITDVSPAAVPATLPAPAPAPVDEPLVQQIATDSPNKNGTKLVGLQIKAALAQLDLDALEFSPVYQCFMEGKLFDQFASDCADTCSAGRAIQHGQCVRAVTGVDVSISHIWEFKALCGEKCWSEKKRITLHHIRLAVADYLNITFQEVKTVRLGLDRAFSRRLSGGMEQRSVFLKIDIQSSRIENSHAEDFKRNFVTTTDTASELVDLRVLQLVSTQSNTVTTNNLEVTADTDPYTPAYNELEPKGTTTVPSSPTELLPTGAIIGIAIGVLVIGAALSTFMWMRRRKAQAQAATAKGKEVEANKIGVEDDNKQAEKQVG